MASVDYINNIENEIKFRGNVVILLRGVYYSIRTPDSGLVVGTPQKNMISGLTVSPTKVNLKRVHGTINSYSFKMTDKDNILTSIFGDDARLTIGEEVSVWLGRSGVDMDFADYFQLPTTTIYKVSHSSDEYSFGSRDAIAAMNKPFFNETSPLQADVLIGTTEFLVDDVTGFANVGTGIVDDEFITWTGRDLTQDSLTGVVRGELGSQAAPHNFGAPIYQVDIVTENPLTLLLQLMISGGGGGIYDVLNDGLGISANLIDVAAIELIRDTEFQFEQYSFNLYNINNALRFIEEQILAATNTRLIVSEEQKISIVLMDEARFAEADESPIGEDEILAYPRWTINEKDVISQVIFEYDFDDITKKYLQRQVFNTELAEPDNFINQKPIKFQFKGVRKSLNGAFIVEQRAERFLSRFETPNPTISITTNMTKSLYEVGQKVLLTSSQIPNASGSLNFADPLEVISRAFNPLDGTVRFNLQYTSYAGIRQAFIAPCVPVVSVVSQSTFGIPAGRSDDYGVGFVIRLWDKTVVKDICGTDFTVGNYIDDGNRTITAIDFDNDLITVDVPFVTTIDPEKHLMRFAEYCDTNAAQKKYASSGHAGGANFADGSSPYRIGF